MATPGADDLIAGPRGRRLCLEIALAADASLDEVVFHAARGFAPDDGSFVVLYAGDGVPQPLPPVPTPSELAVRLGRVSLAAVESVVHDAAALLACLGATVDAAMYWQPPDARDALIAAPELRGSLYRVAERVVRAGALEGWSTPFDGSGSRVEFESATGDPSWPGDVDAVLLAWREATEREESFHRAKAEARPDETWSGTWWSWPTALPATSDTVLGVPSGLALVEDELGWTDALVSAARGAGRVLELDESAWVALCRSNPVDVSASRRGDWGRTTGRTGFWVLPDWASVAEAWDAVHLSTAQYLLLAGRPLPVDAERSSLIAGWGPGVTVWLSRLVRTIGDPVRWTRASAGDRRDPWRPSHPSHT